MKIAISGTHCIGKTSLTYSLAGYLKENGFQTIVNSEKVRECPLPSGTKEKNTIEAVSWILGKQFIDEIELEKKYPIVICDRSVLCIYAYLLWNLENEKNFEKSPLIDISKEIFEKWIKTYDYIFKLELSEQTKLVEDGFRSTEKKWQKEIDELIEKIIKENNIKVYRIPLIKNEKRIQKILEIIKPILEN